MKTNTNSLQDKIDLSAPLEFNLTLDNRKWLVDDIRNQQRITEALHYLRNDVLISNNKIKQYTLGIFINSFTQASLYKSKFTKTGGMA